MTRILTSLLVLATLASGCGRSQSAQRKDQNYQVVEEGQASGVTSTINGPGETPPPMTNTAADTTTNFTLPDNPAPLGTTGSPSNVAGTLPATATPSAIPSTVPPPMASGTVPMTGTVAPPRKHRVQPVPQTPTDTTGTQSGPPATDTSATQAPPPPTDTTKTDTQPPPPTDTAKTDTTSTQKPPV